MTFVTWRSTIIYIFTCSV